MKELVPSDVAILDLLRKQEGMTVTDFRKSLGVTSTAVRQRLTRLLAQGFVEREQIETHGRGRPSHRYQLTREGRRQTGANFGDLAVALWQELRAIKDLEVRRGLLQRLSSRLAKTYSAQVQGETVGDRMEALASLFQQRQIPFEVQRDEFQIPILTTCVCPYPELAEQDATICAMERLLFSELLGEKVHLDRCRLEGDTCCSFRGSGRADRTEKEAKPDGTDSQP
ncbi:MAG: MarR family transcriptional regulator [Planctomycetaceae bacterium]|nr:MarR family transcriptional regulator [Planctomycetaceae bacterium]